MVVHLLLSSFTRFQVADIIPASQTSISDVLANKSSSRPGSNHAWIAAAVLVPVILIAWLIAFALWIRRRKKAGVSVSAETEVEKPRDHEYMAQLPVGSESKFNEMNGNTLSLVSEMDGSTLSPVSELDGGMSQFPNHELPAIEPVGSELESKKEE
jgi:hypothetical protein